MKRRWEVLEILVLDGSAHASTGEQRNWDRRRGERERWCRMARWIRSAGWLLFPALLYWGPAARWRSRFVDSKWPNRESGRCYFPQLLWPPLLRRAKEFRFLDVLAPSSEGGRRFGCVHRVTHRARRGMNVGQARAGGDSVGQGFAWTCGRWRTAWVAVSFLSWQLDKANWTSNLTTERSKINWNATEVQLIPVDNKKYLSQ